MIDLYSLSPDDLDALLRGWGEPRFRADQLRTWLYDQRVTSFAQMTNLPKALRARLTDETTLGTLRVAAEQRSADGTLKRVYELSDGQLVESVLMPYADDRRTACISSQAGCAMGCTFCATGQMGFARHLSTTEIFEQAAMFATELAERGERLSNIVFMGMGEPLHNYDHVIAAVRRLNTDLGIGARRITVSTVGLVPQIRRLAGEGVQLTLAISLHAANDAARGGFMPVNRKWPLAELLAAVRDYQAATRRRVTFEWALIAGQNDTEAQAHELAALLRGLICHVNLIPLNPTQGYDGTPTDPEQAARFVAVLERAGIPATVRVRRGIDIDAGCGQLKSEVLRRRREGGAQPA
ncbi:MAG: 23S rRNA (adenine(2503)-C(2))-methyltransferase RlmN [Deltaproteobacteria bacterium]|nr:MAG: 23S rRNA (adenine(2503)-C(2))-methyltransferase RlmN [Deltaproteobacteria bacterium]